jgi:hypothetical protein
MEIPSREPQRGGLYYKVSPSCHGNLFARTVVTTDVEQDLTRRLLKVLAPPPVGPLTDSRASRFDKRELI